MSYLEVKERMAAAATRVGRLPSQVTLVAVAKTKTVDEIMTVYQLGQRDFGENRAQEMAEKVPALPRDINWHFVGALQSNKTKLVRGATSLLHSMDRESLAAAWAKGPGLPPPVLVEVNSGGEPQKSGVLPEKVQPLVEHLVGLGLEVVGLMAIPPIPSVPDDSRPYFIELRELRDRISADHPSVVELSMGMTDDFEVAIEEGASIIRVGRAIFGPRN